MVLFKYDHGNSNAVCDILTGDKTWIYCFEPETKTAILWMGVRKREQTDKIEAGEERG